MSAIHPAVAAATPSGGIAFPVEVTVTGQNFRPGATVKIGTQAAGIVSVTATEIHATIPGQGPGTMDVTVNNSDGTSGTLSKAFTYTTGPVVYSISPQTGNAAESTIATINGGNLRGDSTITVGGLAAAIQFVLSSTSLEISVPPNPAVPAGGKTSAALTVTNSDGQTFTLPNAFTWTDSRQSSTPATPAPTSFRPSTSPKGPDDDSCGS